MRSLVGAFMNNSDSADPDMLAEYNFTGDLRGRYVQRFAEGTNVVLLDPDAGTKFRELREVNDALRELLKLRKRAG